MTVRTEGDKVGNRVDGIRSDSFRHWIVMVDLDESLAIIAIHSSKVDLANKTRRAVMLDAKLSCIRATCLVCSYCGLNFPLGELPIRLARRASGIVWRKTSEFQEMLVEFWFQR